MFELDPDHADTHSNIGYAYYMTGDNEKAITYLEKALALNPENKRCHFNLASAYLENGDDENALKYF